MHPFTRPSWLQPRTAYVHVPFCGHHCGYCDFAVAAGQDHLIELYLEAVDLELARFGEPQPVETLFIGGGTPTYLSADQLHRLLTSLNRWLPLLSGHPEYSIESTPESITAEKVEVLAARGVTRVSIGVQSFQPHLLAALDRRHGVEHIARAVDVVRRRIPRLSLDLIFGAPGQTLTTWDADLTAALAYSPDHISTYGLTYEKGTPLWKQRAGGMIRDVGEEMELAMYERGIDRLTAAGYEQYEVSNFARPGGRCRHNERYWANDAYHGIGVGAARYIDGRRELNVRDTKIYVKRMLTGESPTFQSEMLSERERAFETMAVQLRRAAGVERAQFQTQTGFDIDELIGETIRGLAAEGLLIADAGSVRFTRRGLCVADGVIEAVMKAR